MSDLIQSYKFTPIIGGATETMDDVEMVSINKGTEVRNNSMRITLKNPQVNILSDGTPRHRWSDSSGISRIKAVKAGKGDVIEEQIVDAYGLYTDTDPTVDVVSDDFLLFSGVVNKGKIFLTPDTNKMELTCLDRTSVMLDKLTIPQAYNPADGWVSPTIIQNILRNASDGIGGSSLKFDSNGNTSINNEFLIDARLFSEGIKSSGTTDSASSRKLIDSGATFDSDGVLKGHRVRNTVDNTYADVLSVDSETQLTLSKNIITSGETYEVSDGFIQDSRPDGTAFPVMSFSQNDKPVIESIEDLSATDKTNTTTEVGSGLVVKRNTRWFIDKKNRFHWYVPDNTPEHIISIGVDTAISPDTVGHKQQGGELTNEVRDKINFIIFNAGADMNGEAIKWYARAPFSGLPVVKDSYRPWDTISRNMKDQDQKAGNITKNQFDDYNFPDGGDYPLTPVWDRDEDSVADDAEYNANFIIEAKLRGIEKSQAIFQLRSNPRWAGKVQIRGEDIQPGDLVDFTSKKHGIKNILVRVNQVTHVIRDVGWSTSLVVEEDEAELEVGL